MFGDGQGKADCLAGLDLGFAFVVDLDGTAVVEVGSFSILKERQGDAAFEGAVGVELLQELEGGGFGRGQGAEVLVEL